MADLSDLMGQLGAGPPAPLALNAGPQYARPMATPGPTSPLAALTSPATAGPLALGAGGSAVGRTVAPKVATGVAEKAVAAAPKVAAEGAGLAGKSKLAAMFAAGGKLGPKTLGRGGLYAIGGQLASGAFDSIVPEQDGTWDDAASSALAWGGAGAGAGSLFGPWGTVIGGLGAGAAGAIWGGINGDDTAVDAVTMGTSPQESQQFTSLMSQLGLSPEAQKQVLGQLTVANYRVTDPQLRAQNMMMVAQNLPAIAAQEQEQRRQLEGLLAAQQMLAPQFDTYMKSLGADSKAFTDANNQFGQQLSQGGNPALGGFIQNQGARSVLSSDATAAAYKAQMQGQVMQQAGQIGAPQSIVDQLRAQYG